MTENSLINEFLNYLKFERHFSPHTAKCYAADLAQFCGFLVGDKGVSGVSGFPALHRTSRPLRRPAPSRPGPTRRLDRLAQGSSSWRRPPSSKSSATS
ncbi:MAG: site-specific integrase [Planctomycetes bacterium]|nr:site-specific integrase [Planctomycetota bacterium]